jgi:hypothetical protein
MPRPLLRFVYLVVLAWSNHDGALTVATSESSFIGAAPDDTDTSTAEERQGQAQALSSINQADEAQRHRQEHAFDSIKDMPELEPLSHPTVHAPEAQPPLLPPDHVDCDLHTPNQDTAPTPTVATANDPESAAVITNDMTLVSQSEDESESSTRKHDLGTSHNVQHQPDSFHTTKIPFDLSATDSRDEIDTTPNARDVEVDDEQLQAAAESIKEAIRMTMTNPRKVSTQPTRDWNDDTKHDNSNGKDPMLSDKGNDTHFAIETVHDSSPLHETKHDGDEDLLEDDDRTLLDIFGESAKAYLTQRVVRVSCIRAGPAAI